MDKSLKALIWLGVSSVVFALLVMTFNYVADPLCYFHCSDIDLNRKTQNIYYQSVQTLAANPDAEIIVLGSSRGERVPIKWIMEYTGKKTINLSQGGADLLLKLALSNIALDRNPKLKTIIWMADYFEFQEHTTDPKMLENPVLRAQIEVPISKSWMHSFLRSLQVLIDHNTLEAALALPGAPRYSKMGKGEGLDPASCASEGFVGQTPKEKLDAEIAIVYPTFSNLLKIEQSAHYHELFLKQIKKITDRGVQVVINIAPYHPKFLARFSMENPRSVSLQDGWVERMRALESPNVKVLNYHAGIPEDDGGPKFWEDGVHPTCHSAIKMLEKAF